MFFFNALYFAKLSQIITDASFCIGMSPGLYVYVNMSSINSSKKARSLLESGLFLVWFGGQLESQ